MDTPSGVSLTIKARDDRFFRAAEVVMRHYDLSRRKELEDGLVVFDVTGGSQDYVVKVHPEWHCHPTCSCPDFHRGAASGSRGYCKHIIAVLLKHEEFRCQLLEAFL